MAVMREEADGAMRLMIFEILNLERKNLRSRAKTDARMSDEIIKIIADHAKTR